MRKGPHNEFLGHCIHPIAGECSFFACTALNECASSSAVFSTFAVHKSGYVWRSSAESKEHFPFLCINRSELALFVLF